MAERTYIEAIHDGLWEEMERDESVLLLGEDVGHYGGAFRATSGMLEHFGPQRILDTPISESAIVGCAIGLSLEGMRPVIEMQFIDFIACAFNMIVNWAAKARYRLGYSLPLVIRGPSGGGVHGGPFHSQNVENFFTCTPGIKIVQPATARDAKGLLKAAVRDDDPVLFLEHKYLYRRIKEDLPEDEEVITPLGKAATLREGEDLVIITYGAMVHTALQAAGELSQEDGIEAEIMDLRSLVPLDEEAVLAAARRSGRVLLLHEATLNGGFGGELAARIAERAFEWLDAPLMRLASPDSAVPFSPPLEEAFLPQVAQVVAKARTLVRY
jgi:2-oxoisovalerate dehydrogenase E1 component beta subunit